MYAKEKKLFPSSLFPDFDGISDLPECALVKMENVVRGRGMETMMRMRMMTRMMTETSLNTQNPHTQF